MPRVLRENARLGNRRVACKALWTSDKSLILNGTAAEASQLRRDVSAIGAYVVHDCTDMFRGWRHLLGMPAGQGIGGFSGTQRAVEQSTVDNVQQNNVRLINVDKMQRGLTGPLTRH